MFFVSDADVQPEADSPASSPAFSTQPPSGSTHVDKVSDVALVPGADAAEANRAPLHKAEFALDERATELAPDMAEGHMGVLQASAEQCCLVKVVKNYDWLDMIRKLQSTPFRTSTSLPPPGGKGMRFFGQASMSSVGLIWDRRKLDMSKAFIWPSGYFAKSEFNVDEKGNLENGRREALVPLEELLLANETLTYQSCGSTVTGKVMPFNEVMLHVSRAEGLIGIFSRSACVKHLLLAMGVRALLTRSLPAAGELPLFVHDPERGIRPFGRAAQAALLSEFLVPAQPSTSCTDGPRLPLDTQSLDLDALQQLEVNGAYGVTSEALHRVISSLLEDHDDDHRSAGRLGEHVASRRAQEMRAILVFGLRASVAADNAASVIALVREVAPLLCSTARGRDEEDLLLHFNVDGSTGMSSPIKSRTDFSAYLHGLAAEARSPGVLAAIGATILLDEFASGRMMSRVDEACKELEGWLHDSDSLFFRLQSWRELQAHHVLSQSPNVTSFVTHKAITNRARFHDALLELEDCNDALGCMSKLHDIVGELHHPCLRLEMLQHILGLGDRYDLKAVLDVSTIAERILKDAMRQRHEGPVGDEDLNEDKPGVLPHKDSFKSHQFEACALRMQGLDFDRGDEDFSAAPPRLV